MADIPYKYKGSILNPLKNLGFFARKPVTEPLQPRPAADNYRGFHVNDWEKCIGCRLCTEVCPQAVFEMQDNKADIVNFNACMECGACVQNCPSEAISVSPGVG